MRTTLLLLLLLPALLGFKHVPQGADETILQEASQGQSLILEGQYQKAQEHFLNLSRKYPQSPLGSFGLMALYNTIMFEDFDFSLEKAFEQESRNNQLIVDKIAADKNSSAWDNFLCGASSGLRGFHYIRNDKAMKALGESQTAKKCLERALEKDPQFYDVNLGLGMFLFWRSVFTNQFKFLPFFKDHRQEGIALMQKAVDQGIIANDLSRAALMFVYLQNNNPRSGLKVADELLQKYPDNVILKNHRGRFLTYLGKNPEALQVFDEVIKNHPKNHVVLYFKGDVLFRMGKTDEAKASFTEYLKTNPTPAWQAYTHYKLGLIALKNNQRGEAREHFRAGDKAYGRYKPNLNMLLDMRKGER